MSTTQSASRIVSSSCSTTSTVLPRSRMPLRVSIRRALSRWCRPMRRLVQDVEHAHQLAADLGGQADALRLAAGERDGRAVERQVVEPDVDHEAQAGGDLLEHLVGDGALARAKRRRAVDRTGQLAGTDDPSAVEPVTVDTVAVGAGQPLLQPLRGLGPLEPVHPGQ